MSTHATTARLHVAFSNYWHAGSGRGNGFHLDALCLRDDDQLPVLPGRQLKGLLRQAVHRAETWGWFSELPLPGGPLTSHEELLFGSRSHSESRDATQPGILQVGSAHLASAERQWLADPQQAELRADLYGELYSTAINEQGTAQDYSLRGMEVSIPVGLWAELDLQLTSPHQPYRVQQQSYLQDGTAWAVLQAALPLLDALGAHRSRGLGEAQVSLHVSQPGA